MVLLIFWGLINQCNAASEFLVEPPSVRPNDLETELKQEVDKQNIKWTQINI